MTQSLMEIPCQLYISEKEENRGQNVYGKLKKLNGRKTSYRVIMIKALLSLLGKGKALVRSLIGGLALDIRREAIKGKDRSIPKDYWKAAIRNTN